MTNNLFYVFFTQKLNIYMCPHVLSFFVHLFISAKNSKNPFKFRKQFLLNLFAVIGTGVNYKLFELHIFGNIHFIQLHKERWR